MEATSRRVAIKNIALLASVAAVRAAGGLSPKGHTAEFWHAEGKDLQCELCPHECLLSVGQTGVCRNRRNTQGTLEAIGYGLPCAIHVDPIEKKPLYHFLPGSQSYSIAVAGCNLRCKNCQNYSISQTSPLDTKVPYRSPASIVDEAAKSGAASISFTYSEPVVWYEYMYDIARCAKKAGLKTVLVTSGYINERPFARLADVIDGAHIDLKSFNDSIYRNLNAGRLEPVLNTIKAAKKKGVWVEIVNLIVPQWSDDYAMIRKMAVWIRENAGSDTPLHFSRFFPLYKLAQLYPTPTDVITRARDIAHEEQLQYVYIGNVPGLEAHTYCPKCRAVLIKRTGYRIKIQNLKNGSCVKCGTALPGVWAS